MPVQWRTPSRRPTGPTIVTCPPNRIVVILSPPSEFACIRLHWVAERNTSVPCMGLPDCWHCKHSPPFEHAYSSGLVYTGNPRRWTQAVLALGDSGGGLATTDFSGSAIVIGKSKEGGKKGPTIYYGTPQQDFAPPPPVAAFDVRPLLLRRWGLFDEAALLECKYHPPEPVLPFPQEDAG